MTRAVRLSRGVVGYGSVADFLRSYQTPCNSDCSLSRMHFNVSPEDLRVIEEVMPKERPIRKST